MITHQIDSDLQFVALIPLPAIAGISNAFIQARVGMGKAMQRPLPPTGESYSYSNSSAKIALRMAQGGESTLLSQAAVMEIKPAPV